MTARRCIARIFAAIWLLLIGLAPVQAYDEVKLRDAERMATLLQAQLRGVVGRVSGGTLSDEALSAQRPLLEKIRTAAKIGSDNASGPLSEIKSQVQGLGPIPENGVEEAEVIATQRKFLNTQLARATAAEKQFVLVGLEADQALARLTTMQQDNFLQRVFKSDKSVLNPGMWAETLDGASVMTSRLSNQIATGWSAVSERVNFTGFLILPLGLGFLGMLFFRFVPNVLARIGVLHLDDETVQLTALEKLWHVIWSLVKYFVAVVVIGFLIGLALDVSGFSTPAFDTLYSFVHDGVKPAIFFGGLVYFVTSPQKPQYRLVAIDSAAAKVLVFVVAASYLITGLSERVFAFASSINLPVTFTVGLSAIATALLIALIAMGLLLLRRQAAKGLAVEQSTYFLTWFVNLMPVWWLLLLIASLALVLGYIALSYFIVGNLLDTAMLAMTMGLLHAFADALAAAALDGQTRTGHAIRRITQWSEQGIQRVVLILRTLADAVLIIVSVLAVIALWTVVLFDVAGFFGTIGEGLRIGNITLSPKAIAIALSVLFFGITATKYITKWLDRRVLAETQLDKGVQNSLRAVAGYTGYSLAAAFALTAAGLDFSSLALVFGALGVGIGLGLQSITNNFVSGLILLVERPVRVGDWIVTTAGEGIVKKINVRATEIETFDNCSIIVPNSNLISSAVSNWTHRDSIGRFGFGVVVTHDADVEAIAKLIMTILQSHPKVMRHPPPSVQLAKIGTQGYEFEMHGHVRDVFEAALISSELRMEIAKQLPKQHLSSSLPPNKPSDPKTTVKTRKK